MNFSIYVQAWRKSHMKHLTIIINVMGSSNGILYLKKWQNMKSIPMSAKGIFTAYSGWYHRGKLKCIDEHTVLLLQMATMISQICVCVCVRIAINDGVLFLHFNHFQYFQSVSGSLIYCEWAREQATRTRMIAVGGNASDGGCAATATRATKKMRSFSW